MAASATDSQEDHGLTQLFRVYQPQLLYYLRGRAGGAADDLAGDVWIAVARNLARFTGDEHAFRSWLFTIARCRLVDHWRKEARRRTEPAAALERFDQRGASDGAEGDPSSPVIERMSAEYVLDCIVDVLTRDQAEALILRSMVGLPVAEVARLMGCSEISVRVLCHRARRRLAARFPEGMPTL